jgi:hypothetical protein
MPVQYCNLNPEKFLYHQESQDHNKQHLRPLIVAFIEELDDIILG